MANSTITHDTNGLLFDLADDAWTAGELDEFSNASFLERMSRFTDDEAIIHPLAASGPVTPLRPVDDRFQRRLARRRSVRVFSDDPLSQRSVERLLAATGVGTDGRRVVPTAGGLESVTAYAICCRTEGAGSGRIVRYDAGRHAFNDIAAAPDETTLRAVLNLGDDSLAAMYVVFVAALGRLRSKYGVRGDRFALIETGCAAQNVELRLAEERLAGYQVGGVRTEMAGLLRIDGLPARVTGVIACGVPASA